jgi:DNA polymerase-1
LTKLLIDGDVIAFVAAAAAQKVYMDAFGIVQPFAHRQEGEAICDNLIGGLLSGFSTDNFEVYLSDPHANWRKEVMPSYKANRVEDWAGQTRPLLLPYMKGYLTDKYKAVFWPELEADDVLGILSTADDSGESIICGKDKDFKTIPGRYHRLKDFDSKGKPVVNEITKWQATRFHLYQTLKGDPVDGYPGCPGIGDTRAEEVLDHPVVLTPQPGVKTSGKNKGDPTVKWVSEPTTDLWAMVVSQYRKAGQSEKEALLNARVANILHNDQYDRETKEITLWTPSRIRL